jgi:hypothetical protein
MVEINQNALLLFIFYSLYLLFTKLYNVKGSMFEGEC